MELKNQVVSLELTKRIKELGVKQESFCYWFQPNNAVPAVPLYGDSYKRWKDNVGGKVLNHGGVYAAFTVAELGEMLPKEIDKARPYKLQCYKSSEGWRVEYWAGFNGSRDFRAGADNYAASEADARAKMLIYLLENKLITL